MSGGFDIQAFRNSVTADMARPSQFTASFTSPIDNSGALQAPFRIAATQIPQWTLGVARVAYFGRMVPLPGDREFQPWTTIVYNDEDFLIRNALEGWSNTMNGLQSNVRQLATSNYTLYAGTGAVTQYSKTGIPIRTYQFNGIWPQIVSDIKLGWALQNETEAFQVTWQYLDFEIVAPNITGLPAPGTF